jgi:DNA-damage-inducible protein J
LIRGDIGMKNVKRQGGSGKASAKKAQVKARKATAKTIPKATATGMIHARIAQSLKVKVEKILAELGLNSSDAIRLFYSQVALRKGLPFEVHIPNATTAKALRDIDAGRDVTRYGSAEELFEDLGI